MVTLCPTHIGYSSTVCLYVRR